MLKPITAAALGLTLMGCHSIDTTMAIGMGTLRVEPHPIHEDSVRVTTVHNAPLYFDTLGRGRGTSEAQRNTVDALFGGKCRGAPIIQEGTVQLMSLRQDAVLRVICPAARGTP